LRFCGRISVAHTGRLEGSKTNEEEGLVRQLSQWFSTDKLIQTMTILLTAMNGFTIFVPTRHDSVVSFAAIAKENADDEGDHVPALYIYHRDMPPCRVLLR
jgi:hypothetical protein